MAYCVTTKIHILEGHGEENGCRMSFSSEREKEGDIKQKY
jgi:hypothetical protein